MPLGSSGNLGWHHIAPFTICPKEYQFARVRGISVRSPFHNEPLSIGLLLHAARAQWLYDRRKGEAWREAMLDYAERMEREEKPLHPSSFPIAVQTFEAYAAYWSVRPSTQVLAVEYLLKPRALTPDAPEWTWRSARLDSIERWRGKAWIGEFKSTSSAPSRVTDIYVLNGQTLLQMALWSDAETAKFGELGGVLLDVVVKPSGKKPARAAPRVAIPAAEMQAALKWFRRDFTTWVMQASMIDWNAHVERRPVCMRSQGPCMYRPLCTRGRVGSNQYVFADGSPISGWKASEGKEVAPWE